MKTLEELNEWLKTVKRVCQESTYDHDSDMNYTQSIYEDAEGNLFQIDWYPSGFHKSSPISFTPVPVEKDISTYIVEVIRYEPTTELRPYDIAVEEHWEEVKK